MIQLEQIKPYFPAELQGNVTFLKYMLKEYIQLMILDYLSTSSYVTKITFIGGTNLRLIKGIDRFSENLDFDCKHLTQDEFLQMTDDVLVFLQRAGFSVEPRDKTNNKLKAFRRNIYFPELLFNQGRDFYDAMFLLGQTEPDYGYLTAKCDIHDLQELKVALKNTLAKIDIIKKSQDFEHLLFNKSNLKRVLIFGEFTDALS